jgi:hypothetical protein
MANHVVIVCGYVTVLGKSSIIRYLDRVISFCNKHQPDIIIFSGGYTTLQSNPYNSEAGAMREYVIESLLYSRFNAFLEDESCTSLDNIRLVAAMLRRKELLDRETKITIFCESGSALAIDILAWHFLRRSVDIETSHWLRESPEQLLLGANITWLCTKIPPLAHLWRWYRKRRAKNL